MADLLVEGVEFESYDAFHTALEEYEDANFVQFVRTDSRSVEKALETSLSKTYNPEIKFVQLAYTCTFGPRKATSKSTGQRMSNSRKIDCPVRLRVSSTPDGQRLVIRESKLDCHNHEISEEQYKALGRQKQLDEETELEIYNLINMHEDKRLARSLIREKLNKETGRPITYKDISNIEKRVSRKLELEKKGISVLSSPATTTAATDDKDEAGDETQRADPEENPNNEEDSQDEESESVDKKPQKKAIKALSSPGRPQRNRREPKRFRDAVTANGLKSLHDSKDGISDGEDYEPTTVSASSSRKSLVKGKEEPTPRGRKRKFASHVEQSDSESIQERKLAIKEELLDMEKKKMKILQDIVKKLDIIIANQKKSK